MKKTLIHAGAAMLFALVGAAPASAQPVSYTHLRAHETVLDLVCRLLLEKKKTQRHNIRPRTHNNNIKNTPTTI